MIRELKYITTTPEDFLESINPIFMSQVFRWREKGVDYNTSQSLPYNWREIDSNDYHHRLSSYTPVAMLCVQFWTDYEGRPLEQMLPAHLYFYRDGTGLAFEHMYWARETKFYAFGCSHNYKELSIEECKARGLTHHGMCWHVYECSECGHIKAEDSSG